MARRNAYRILIYVLAFLCQSQSYSHTADRIVGSSTLFSVLSAVADHFYFKDLGKPPLIEATGTGSGIRLFCSKGPHTPAVVAASRRMAEAERAYCQQNDFQDILEIDLGFDGIVLVSPNPDRVFDLSVYDLKQAVAHKGSLPRFWSDLNKKYPHAPVKILAPPSTAGTYESLLQLLSLQHFRKDEAFRPVSDQETILVQKLTIEEDALGILSFAFILKNPHLVFPYPINGVVPSAQTIQKGTYPLSRRLYIYVHRQKILTNQNLKLFLNFLTSPSTTGPGGLFKNFGLIPHESEHYRALHAQWQES